MVFITCTSNCRTIYLKQKNSIFTRLLHKKNCSGTLGLQEKKTVPNIIIHSSPAYNIITSSYHTRLQQDEMTKILCPLLHHHSQKLVKSH